MKLTDNCIVIHEKRWNETAFIRSILTPEYGRISGLMPQNKRTPPVSLGDQGIATWQARLPEHLGRLSIEIVSSSYVYILRDACRLAALSCACTLAYQCLPEQHPYPEVYQALQKLIETLTPPTATWEHSYLAYEIALLEKLGFGLDLSCCAATQTTEDLVYISPKTGRAVSKSAGYPYKSQLLPLPAYLRDKSQILSENMLKACLNVTGFFLSKHVVPKKRLPDSRQRLLKTEIRKIA